MNDSTPSAFSNSSTPSDQFEPAIPKDAIASTKQIPPTIKRAYLPYFADLVEIFNRMAPLTRYLYDIIMIAQPDPYASSTPDSTDYSQ